MEYTSPNFPLVPEEDVQSSEKESMEDLLNRVTKLALETIRQLSKEEEDDLP